jgi:hypothetical protein
VAHRGRVAEPGRMVDRRWVNRVAAMTGISGVVVAAAAAMAAVTLYPEPRPHAEAAGGQPGRCAAHYAAQYGTGGAFTAEVALTNTGASALDRWSLAFALPRGQQITAATGALWWQQGESVTLRGQTPLVAGGTVRLALTGRSTATAAAPTTFMLDGAACAAEAVAGVSTSTPAGPAAVPAAGARGERSSPKPAAPKD